MAIQTCSMKSHICSLLSWGNICLLRDMNALSTAPFGMFASSVLESVSLWDVNGSMLDAEVMIIERKGREVKRL